MSHLTLQKDLINFRRVSNLRIQKNLRTKISMNHARILSMINRMETT